MPPPPYDPRQDPSWRLALEFVAPERRRAIERALAHLGLVEQPLGSNDEPTGTIDGWLRAAHAPEGSPWCASALSDWLELPEPCAGAVRLGSRFPRVAVPLAGDGFYYHTDDQGHGHCGLIIGVQDAPWWVLTIEGNLDHGVRCVARDAHRLKFFRVFDAGAGLLPIPNGVPFRETHPYAGVGGTR